LSLYDIQLKLQEAIKHALNEPYNIADVEIYHLVRDDDTIKVEGHYELSSFLTIKAEGKFKIRLDKNLEILELELTE